MKKLIRNMSFTAMAVVLSSVSAFGADAKLSRELKGLTSGDNIDVIIQYKEIPTDSQHEKVEKLGGQLKHRYDFLKAGHYTMSAKAIQKLSEDPEVTYITPDRPVKSLLNYSVGAVYANVAHQNRDLGWGSGVALIDSGVDGSRPDLQGNIAFNEDFTGSGNTNDGYGHGSHVAGIILSSGVSSNGLYQGVAPGAYLLNLRVLNSSGLGTDSWVIAAINRAIQLKNSLNVRVMNLSLGRPVYESASLDPLCQAVESAWKAGIFVVTAAGNDGRDNPTTTKGYGTIQSPANDPLVITVGAMKTESTMTRSDDLVASYSSKGPTAIDHYVKPDLVAPGNQVASVNAQNSLLSQEFPANVVNQYYIRLSGTSMAAPVVSGAALLMLQQSNWMTPDQIKAVMMKTATKNFPASSSVTVAGVTYTDHYDIFTIGAGYLDVTAALADNSTWINGDSAVSPVAIYNPSTKTVTVNVPNDGETSGSSSATSSSSSTSASNVIWGSNVVWGSNVIWGSVVLAASNVISGSNVVWGTSTISGFSTIWSSSTLAGTSTTAAESLPILVAGEN